MPELTIAELASLGGKRYIAEVRARLTDDEAWLTVLDPRLLPRTRWALQRVIDSINTHEERILSRGETPDPDWLRRASALRQYAKGRLGRIPPGDSYLTSNTKEARAWRAFSARLARVLAELAPDALENVQAPYGGLSAAQWLSMRESKNGKDY